MKTKRFFLLFLIILTAVCAVSAKSVTQWWSGYTAIDDFNYGKVNVYYRAWDNSDGSQTIVCVYLDPADKRVQYKSADFADKSKLPFAQITDIPYSGTIHDYNLATNADKFGNFQFTLYSADSGSATFAFSGSVVSFGSTYQLYTDKTTVDFNASAASVIPDVQLSSTSRHGSSSGTGSGSSSSEVSTKEAVEAAKAGVEFIQWLVDETSVEHPTGTVVCEQCHGSGVCPWCKGTGRNSNGFMCSHCNFLGDGKCSRCEGKGWY